MADRFLSSFFCVLEYKTDCRLNKSPHLMYNTSLFDSSLFHTSLFFPLSISLSLTPLLSLPLLFSFSSRSLSVHFLPFSPISCSLSIFPLHRLPSLKGLGVQEWGGGGEWRRKGWQTERKEAGLNAQSHHWADRRHGNKSLIHPSHEGEEIRRERRIRENERGE